MKNLQSVTLWTAIVTPFLDNGKIDFLSFERLLRRQEAAGNGVVILGSTGEGLALNDDEKREVVRFTGTCKLHVPVMVGVGGFNLGATQRWIEENNQHAFIHAYLLVTPLYAKPGARGQCSWFAALLEASQKPCMLYNVPSRTGVKLHTSVLRELKDHSRFWAVKEASGSVTEFQDYREAAPGVAFFSGDDGLTPFFASAGAVGLVSVMSNVWPEASAEFVYRCVNRDTGVLLPTWRTASDAMFLASNPVPAKALLHELGLITSAYVRPPLSMEDLPDRSKLIMADSLVQRWMEQYG